MPNLFGKKMIEISNLTKHTGNTTIISDFSFSAHSQECLGLFGKDHTAKTALLNLIAGSTQPSSGYINIQGFNTQTQALKARKLVGYQLSKDLGHPTMSVNTFLGFIAAVRGFHGAEKRARLEHVVARLELFPVLNAPSIRSPLPGNAKSRLLRPSCMVLPCYCWTSQPKGSHLIRNTHSGRLSSH